MLPCLVVFKERFELSQRHLTPRGIKNTILVGALVGEWGGWIGMLCAGTVMNKTPYDTLETAEFACQSCHDQTC